MTPNYSLHAIPVYWVLAMFPHAYAVQTIKKANNGKWDNVNSRGISTNASYQKSVPSEAFGRYERAEAAHKNMLENAPCFIGAILASNMMGLSSDTMNIAIGSYLALRVAYIFAYIKITRPKYSYVRSLIWAVSLGIMMRLYIKAGNKLVAQGRIAT